LSQAAAAKAVGHSKATFAQVAEPGPTLKADPKVSARTVVTRVAVHSERTLFEEPTELTPKEGAMDAAQALMEIQVRSDQTATQELAKMGLIGASISQA